MQASGKSTWAKEQVANSKGRVKRVSRDDLRAMIDPKWSGQKEKAIVHARDSLVRTFLTDNYDVIVDDTNLHPSNTQQLEFLAREAGATFVVQDFTHVPLQECLKRDALREGTARVGEKVILETYKKYLTPPKPKYVYGGKECIIVDIDGTLAEHVGRSPYEEMKCDTDVLIESAARIVEALTWETGAAIKLFSGRTEAARELTEQWLNENQVLYTDLTMRQIGDSRPDYVVKEEMYRTHIEGKFNVLHVIDDRKQVCLMWKYVLNLPLLYVGDFIDF